MSRQVLQGHGTMQRIVTMAENVTRMIAGTAQSSGVIWRWSVMTMNGCCAIYCSTLSWLKQ